MGSRAGPSQVEGLAWLKSLLWDKCQRAEALLEGWGEPVQPRRPRFPHYQAELYLSARRRCSGPSSASRPQVRVVLPQGRKDLHYLTSRDNPKLV